MIMYHYFLRFLGIPDSKKDGFWNAVGPYVYPFPWYLKWFYRITLYLFFVSVYMLDCSK
jgi:hypothetical protein